MKIFVDFDDTLVKSRRAIVKCVNDMFHLSRTEDDITDWGFRSLKSDFTRKDVEGLFESDTFWNNVELYEGAVETLKGHEVHLCTVGTKKNLQRKAEFLSKHSLPYLPAFVNSDEGKSQKDKKSFDMAGAIQIGDTWQELEHTNASVKILFKDYHDYPWQEVPPNAEVYIVDTWKEISEIIGWCSKYGSPCNAADR